MSQYGVIVKAGKFERKISQLFYHQRLACIYKCFKLPLFSDRLSFNVHSY